MLRDPELSMLLEQAARNLSTLELLAQRARETDLSAIQQLRERLEQLKQAYTDETNALTQQVIKGAIERRRGIDRRQLARRGSNWPLTSMR